MITDRLAFASLIALVPVALTLAGCSRDKSLECSKSVAYLEAREDGPLRVPDSLTVPDEVEALRIPGRPATDEASASREDRVDSNCLELSPAFSLPVEQ